MERELSVLLPRVRRRQLFLVSAGVVGALLPALARGGVVTLGAWSGLSWLAPLLFVPLAFVLFAAAVEQSQAALSERPAASFGLVRLAGYTFVPCVGAFVEVALLYRLAQETSRVDNGRDRSGLVLALALGRLGAVWLVAPVLRTFVGTMFGYSLIYSAGPLISFALLGVITQIIAAPLLDHAEAGGEAQPLSAAGAGGPTAVPSSIGAAPTQKAP